MKIKKILVICIIVIVISMISVMHVICVEVDDRGLVSSPQASDAIHIGMSKEDLHKIYRLGDIRKYERKDNEEVFVFDDTLTSGSDDTVTVHLIDGKVKSWDKNRVIFPTDKGLRSAIHPDILKEDLLKIYPIGNLKSYTKNDNKEVGVFDDISTSDPDDTITFYMIDGKVKSWKRNKVISLTKEELHKIFPIEKRKAYVRSGNTEAETFYNILTSDPDDTVTFYLVGGKVNSWEINTEASIAHVKFIDKTMASVRLKAESDADARLKSESDSGARLKAESDDSARLKAESDFKEIISNARSERDARLKAMEERSRYNSYSQNYSTKEDDIVKSKQQNRSSSMRRNNWYYKGGLYYR